MTAAPRFSGVLFGAAYYAEYQPDGTLDRDLDLMAEAGFTVIRVGESVWSTWEPREGEFDLDWLQPVLDGAHARGIGVILGIFLRSRKDKVDPHSVSEVAASGQAVKIKRNPKPKKVRK